MRISERQALVLFDILKWSTCIVGEIKGYSPELRLRLVNEIVNQQSDVIVELDRDKQPEKTE